MTTLTNSPIFANHRERTPASARLYARAREVLPSGIVHDARWTDPHPIYVSRASGPRKWDADGNEYVDYMGGHGALLLGHNHPQVTPEAHAQLDRGTHFGACHELEVEWAERICRMVPSAERVRFTSSGTEATLLGLRLARALTGRPKVVRFVGHFHGWHDHFATAYAGHYDGSAPPGVLPQVAADAIPAHTAQPDAVAEMLETRDDIAAVIIEPTGASFGRVPVDPALLRRLREITARRGIVLIFDEVITGFRVSPGGAQGHHGVTPDLTTLAKIVAGGLPGGALAARRDLIDLLDFEATRSANVEKILHFGTFNANPLSASAGIAALDVIATTDACARANDYGERLRRRMNEVFAEEGLDWAAYGEFSGFQIFTNPKGREVEPLDFDPHAVDLFELKNNDGALVNKLQIAMLNHGVDINGWPGGLISCTHGEAEMEQTISALGLAIRELREEGALAS